MIYLAPWKDLLDFRSSFSEWIYVLDRSNEGRYSTVHQHSLDRYLHSMMITMERFSLKVLLVFQRLVEGGIVHYH